MSLFKWAASVYLSFRQPFQATNTEREKKKRFPKTLKWIIRVEHAVTDRDKSLWQPQTCIKETPQKKKSEREARDEGLHENRKNTREKLNSEKRVSLAGCRALMGNGCYSSASIQQLVPNPLGRNASPIPLSACLRHTADRLSARCFCSAATDLHACIAVGAASGLMGQSPAEVILDTFKHAESSRTTEVERKGIKVYMLTLTNEQGVMS